MTRQARASRHDAPKRRELDEQELALDHVGVGVVEDGPDGDLQRQ
jgi:hypothetical protein